MEPVEVSPHRETSPPPARPGRLAERVSRGALVERPRLAVLTVLILTAILYLPVFSIGFFSDDFYWLPALDPPAELASKVVPYFISFEEPETEAWWKARGIHFWWASREFRWTLMRPAANRLLELQWRAFGPNPPAYHLVSLVTYLGFVTTAYLLYRRLLQPGVALLAFLLVASHFGHLQTVWLICNQHSIFSALGGLLALLAYLRWREEGWRPGLLLCLAGFTAGLLFGETTIAMTGYFVAYELWGSAGARRQRLVRLLPLLTLLMGYLVLHHVLGYTTRGSLLYLDPAREPRALLEGALSRFPPLLTGLWNVIMADLWTSLPAIRPVLGGVAAIVCTLIGLLLREAWSGLEPAERRAVTWMGAGSFLALLPGLASPPGGRLLLCATVGGSVVLALIFRHAWRVWRQKDSGGRRRVFLIGAAPLILLNLVLLPLGRPGMLFALGRLTSSQITSFRSAEIDDLVSPEKDFIVLNMPGPVAALSFLSARGLVFGSPLPHGWTVLSCAPFDLRVTRTDAHTLELEVLGGSLLGDGFQRLFRPASWPVRAGDLFDQGAFQARILAVDETGPSRVAFHFRQTLDDSRYQLLVWRDGTLRQSPMPPPGGQIIVPAAPSPIGPGM